MEKREALEKIVKCAKMYKNNLAGRVLLFICVDKVFYKKSLSGKLSLDDFELAGDGTTALKLQVLPFLMEKDLSAKMIGDYDRRQPRLYTDKLAGNIRGCLGFKEVVPGKFVPNTVLNVDIRQQAINLKKVSEVYIRNKDVTEYERII